MNKVSLKKAEFRLVVYYAGDADVAVHAMKSSEKIGPYDDLSILVAFPEVEEIQVHPTSRQLIVNLGDENSAIRVPVGGVINLKHPDEDGKEEKTQGGDDLTPGSEAV